MADANDSGVSLANLDHTAFSESTPSVFQCSNCNTIIGDSLSWISADKITRTIALSGVAGRVGVRADINVAYSGRDEGSTYKVVYCLECNENLGKKYIASSPEVDSLRGLYSLSAEKLNSYKLGVYERNNNLTDILSWPGPVEVWRQVSKIKYLLVSINERLSTVEEKMGHEERKEMHQEQLGTKNDKLDSESVTSTENISTHSNCANNYSDAQVENQRRQDSTECQGRHRHADREVLGDIYVPLEGRGTRSRSCMSSSQSGFHLMRHSGSKDLDKNKTTDVEQENRLERMERWPHDDNADGARKRKRITSP